MKLSLSTVSTLNASFAEEVEAYATAGFDGLVRLSDPTTGKLVKEFVPVPK